MNTYSTNDELKLGGIKDDITLIKGDCLEIMKELSELDVKVDMVLTDLPYGVLNRKNENAKWDNTIDINIAWTMIKSIINDNCPVVLFGQGMFTVDLMNSNRGWWRYNLIWDKVLSTGFLNSKIQPLRRHEDIIVFSKYKSKYNPQMTKCEPHKRNHSKGNMQTPAKNSCYGKYVETPTIISDEKYPTSIISIPKEHSKDNFFHPTQKPVALLEYLIKTYTNEGDTVLDFTMGSGSTGEACVNTKRKFIGIELDNEYFNVSNKRIMNAIIDNNRKLF